MAVNDHVGVQGTREGFHLHQALMERMLITDIRVGQRRHSDDMLELMALRTALQALDTGRFKLTEMPVVCRHRQTQRPFGKVGITVDGRGLAIG
ncbi:hypothetical_protein [Leishmania major strain Friedlin]|nr:hypothetical_protein [Leishmania major strain Friedlin]